MSNRRTALTVLAGCALASGAGSAMVPTRKVADERPVGNLGKLIPEELGGWRMDRHTVPLLPAPDVQAKLDAIYNQVLARTYLGPRGQRVMLSIAYGGDQSDGLKAHRPEVCYSAQGFATRNLNKGSLQLGQRAIPVMRLVAHLGGRTEPITYWLTIGSHVARTGIETKLAQLSYSVRGLIPDGMLMRISSIDANALDAYRQHDEFAVALARAVPAEQAWRFFGA